MNDPSDAWLADDGPPPTDEERAEAARLAVLLALSPAEAARAAAQDAVEVESAALTALRVKATARPDDEAARDASRRAVEGALAQGGAQRGWRKVVRTRWLWAAAAALVVVGIGLGVPAPTPEAPASFSRDAETLFDRPVELGAGSAPARLIFDARMHDYRSTMLGTEQP